MKLNILQRTAVFLGLKKRSAYSDAILSGTFLTGSNESGEVVSVLGGTRINTVFNCINNLSQDVAKLPLNIRQNTKSGRVIVKNTPVYNLIHSRPNDYTTAYNFWYGIVFETFSQGNGYAVIKRNAKYQPEELIPIKSEDVDPVLIDGTLYYEYKGVMIHNSDMLHFKMYSFDGVKGISPIIHNASTIGLRLKQDKYKARILGTKPPGILTFDQQLSADQIKENREAWNRMTQGDGLGGTPVLSGGAKYQGFMVNATDGQIVEVSQMSDEHIAGIFRMPPAFIQNYRNATFSNAEQQDIVYLKYTITPILQMMEQEMNNKLFPEANKMASEPLYVNFNIKGFLRGDMKTQMEFYKFLRDHGIASANTILEMEDLPKLEGEQGDMIVIQGAMIPLDQLKDFYAGKSAAPNNLDNKQRAIGYELIKEGDKLPQNKK